MPCAVSSMQGVVFKKWLLKNVSFSKRQIYLLCLPLPLCLSYNQIVLLVFLYHKTALVITQGHCSEWLRIDWTHLSWVQPELILTTILTILLLRLDSKKEFFPSIGYLFLFLMNLWKILFNEFKMRFQFSYIF